MPNKLTPETLAVLHHLADSGDHIAAGIIVERLRSKYILACVGGPRSDSVGMIHMKADDDFVTKTPLASDATIAQACAYAEALRQDQYDHYLDAGATETNDAAHRYVDTVNQAALQAIPAATEINSLIALVEALNAARKAHGFQTVTVDATLQGVTLSITSNVHFGYDNWESDIEITHTAPANLTECILSLNELQSIFVKHFARAAD